MCLGLINEWMSILNFESIIIELEQLLAQPSPSKPLVKDVGTLLLLLSRLRSASWLTSVAARRQ